ncbi:class II aldolase/adducin family protein [Parathalassolituus penaei]|uniref:Class II aldolase/adducin family protein n=1 Tax=Parathalassolituus penaei TaxID=2997323 RepID=A0A9X3EER3_9GAMM|nr:class II aldolase/adducin family protein [Parathalassolituus penaei]MCY0966258.1 class II aldolase/adducin family protein [Parathalassolituus penaei]
MNQMTSRADTVISRPDHISEDEWALRVKLAHCYHLVDYFGWTETIFNHISARLMDQADCYLVNPFGLNYTEITPANLIKVDVNGKKLCDSPYDGNPAGFALHGAIHAAREDVHCVIHTHTNAVSAVAAKPNGFAMNNFYAAQLYGRVGYHAFEGITLFQEEKGRMLESLGDKHILVLRNHGIAVGEMDVERTFFLLWTVQRAAEIQVAAGSIGGEDVILEDAIGEKCAGLTQMLIKDSGFAVKFFDAMVRKMEADRGPCW